MKEAESPKYGYMVKYGAINQQVSYLSSTKPPAWDALRVPRVGILLEY